MQAYQSVESPVRPVSGHAGALHVTHAALSLDVGGLERLVLEMVKVGRRKDHRVSVLCLERAGTLAAAAEAEGAEVVALDKPPGRTPALGGRIAEVIRRLRPDVIHTHQVGALWYVGNAVSGVPMLHTEHTDTAVLRPGLVRTFKSRALLTLAARHAGAFCCVSDSVARSVRRWSTVPARKVCVVANGIDVDHFAGHRSLGTTTRHSLGIPLGRTVIGTVGRLNEVKCQDLLLKAVAAMSPALAEPHVVLVGDGPERQRLTRLAAELGLADRTHFCGYQPNPERFMAAMDVFVLSSRTEGLPLSLLEAWAVGVPTVATAVGGIPAIVRSGTDGLLVPFGDVHAMSDAIGRLLNDAAFALRLADAATRTVRAQYSLDRMNATYERLYRDLVRQGDRP